MELLVVIAILMIISGIAVYGFVGITNTYRIRGAVGTVDSMLRGARQIAINKRSDRRVALEIYTDPSLYPEVRAQEIPVRCWVERRYDEFDDWTMFPYDADPEERLELASTDIQQVPEFMRVADVTGLDVYTLLSRGYDWRPPGRIILFFEYDATGACRPYLNCTECDETRNGVDLTYFLPRPGVYIHFARRNTQIPGDLREADDSTPFYYGSIGGRVLYLVENGLRLNVDQLNNLGGPTGLTSLDQITGNMPDFPQDEARVQRIMRRRVGTIHLISLTGRTRAYDYGIGYPWTKAEIYTGAEP